MNDPMNVVDSAHILAARGHVGSLGYLITKHLPGQQCKLCTLKVVRESRPALTGEDAKIFRGFFLGWGYVFNGTTSEPDFSGRSIDGEDGGRPYTRGDKWAGFSPLVSYALRKENALPEDFRRSRILTCLKRYQTIWYPKIKSPS